MINTVVSVLLGNTDSIFGQSLLNHLLICGVEQPVLESRARDLVRRLRHAPFDLIIVDTRLYELPAVRAAVNEHHRTRRSAVMLVFDDYSPPMSLTDLRNADFHLCVAKSTAPEIVSSLMSPIPP